MRISSASTQVPTAKWAPLSRNIGSAVKAANRPVTPMASGKVAQGFQPSWLDRKNRA